MQRPPATSRGGEATEATEATDPATATATRRGGFDVYLMPMATLIVGLIVTGALVLVSHSQFVSNEKRLLALRVHDANAAVTGALSGVQTPLVSAAEVADATNGNMAKFKRFAAPLVGAVGSGRAYNSLSLWRVNSLASGPVAVQGVPPVLSLIHI